MSVGRGFRTHARLHCADGRFGELSDVVIGPAMVDDEKQIAQLVLEHGHLWGKRRVAIAGRAIALPETDELTLSLSSHKVEALKRIR